MTIEPSTSYFDNQEDLLSLTNEERVACKMALQAKVEMSLTAEEKTDIRRALQHAVYADPGPARLWNWFGLPVRLPAMAFAVLLLLGASGGGLVYAAEKALPGDALYGVKIHVNEVLGASFNNDTPEERAQWAVRRLERRMEELRRLEARGSADVDVVIGDYIEAAAHDVEIEVEALPAAAAERAALRTAVRSAIGTDDDSLRRASRINRVLKALGERSEQFDVPHPAVLKPVPPSASVKAGATASVGPLTISRPSTSSSSEASSRGNARARSSGAASVQSEAASSAIFDGDDVTDVIDEVL